MSYVIIQDSKNDQYLKLFMLDHKKTGFWWSWKLDESTVKLFDHEEQARQVAVRLHYNHPQVVSLITARALHNANKRYKDELARSQAHLEPWDEHKD